MERYDGDEDAILNFDRVIEIEQTQEQDGDDDEIREYR